MQEEFEVFKFSIVFTPCLCIFSFFKIRLTAKRTSECLGLILVSCLAIGKYEQRFHDNLASAVRPVLPLRERIISFTAERILRFAAASGDFIVQPAALI